MIVNKPKKKKSISRYSIMLYIMGGIFTVITLKLLYIQIYKHDDYKEKANSTSTKFVSEKAPRGEILDRTGNILATNKQTYALTYTTTAEANKAFYSTMDSIFEILSQNNETIQDDLKLKINDNDEVYIEYENISEELVKSEDIRFKRDRGLNEIIEKKLGYDVANEDLTDDQIDKVNEELYKITPDEVFDYLVKSYGLIDLITEGKTAEEIKEYNNLSDKEITKLLLDSGYTKKQLREYMVVKDALKMKSFQGHKTVTIKSNLNKDIADIVLQKLNKLPGIDVTLEPTRYYPYNNLGSSVLGYLSSISQSNEEEYSLKGYDVSTDLVGVSGIEYAFEDQLRGVTGGTTVKVNSSGRVTEELFKLEAYPGNTVQLTIDKDIQYVAEQQLAKTMEDIRNTGEYPNANRGAVVAAEAKTGKILALVSLPNYDPNLFAISGQLSSEQNQEYFNPDLEKFGNEYIQRMGLNKTIDELFPVDSNGNREDIYDIYPRSFYNYATQGLVPPGSTFKPMTSLIGLEEGVITPTSTIYDHGVFNQHPETFGESFAPECLAYTNGRGSHGDTNVETALAVSCNYFFYEVGYRLYINSDSKVDGLNAIAKYAWRFGLGVDPEGQQRASTGIEISENFGQVYNFTSYKNSIITMAKFNLRDNLEAGSLRGYSFVPFDYSDRDEDTEELKEAKTSLKDKITQRLKAIDPDSKTPVIGSDAFSETLYDDIRNIMNNSELYKENVKSYEASTGKEVNKDNEVVKIANAISQYIIHDIGSEMTSPAQEVFAAIGQGMNNFTPLQLVQYVSTLVNGGTRYKLHLLDKILSPDGEVIQESVPEILNKIELSKESVDAVKAGMSMVNVDDTGTAFATFANFPISTAGKTGTADFRSDQTDYGRSPYATYVSFAPVEDPEIVVAAVIYDGGHGSSAAPVAKAIYEAYFKDRILSINPNYEFNEFLVNAPADNRE